MFWFMELNKLFRLSREVQGLKQSALVKKLHISQSSLSQFENGQSTLSSECLLTLAPLLKINPGYLMCESKNPFSSPDLIKMLLTEKILVGVDYTPLEYVVMVNPGVQVVFLLATSMLDKALAKTVVGQLTLAILVRDQDGNTFIFRRNSRGSYIVGEGNLQAKLQAMEKEDENKVVTVRFEHISKALAKKISAWDVTLTDVQGFFESKVTKTLTLAENRVIELMRAEKLDLEAVEQLLRHMKE
ncbi:MAG: helix-turn-helix transcriptional regulator [Deltaproteobacteria bacterium]|nr:helix-turn-helix transcriptional regulator [Deltaproteobacteria bacterium]